MSPNATPHEGDLSPATRKTLFPNYSFHLVETDEQDYVRGVTETTHSDLWINGGYFVFKREIFDYMKEGEELVVEPFQRLIEKKELLAVPYDGFWRSMDTFRDKTELDELCNKGVTPWQVWERR